MAGREDYDLEFVFEILQKFKSSRADVYTCITDLSCWKFYLNFKVVVKVYTFVAVNQSFIEIENYGLLANAVRLSL